MNEANRLWVDSMPDAYDRLLVPAVFDPFAHDLARRALDCRPRAVLELAAGTGALTRLMIADGLTNVTATDFNPGMVATGAARAPEARWQQADASHLPFDDGALDLVVCQFGVMFFPDKPAAFAEAARVLAPQGTLLFNTWDTIDTHDFAAALLDALQHAYPDNPPTFIQSVPHGYNDVDTIAGELRSGGFSSVAFDRVVLDGHAGSAEDVARGFCEGTPVRAEMDARDGDVQRVTAEVTAAMVRRLGEGAVTGSMAALVFQARR